jgi:hypothetical protein
MYVRLASLALLLIVTVAIAAAVFRASTGPDRRAERHNIARATCVKAGGEWVWSGRDEICKKREVAGR